jgi:hypothetical protein
LTGQTQKRKEKQWDAHLDGVNVRRALAKVRQPLNVEADHRHILLFPEMTHPLDHGIIAAWATAVDHAAVSSVVVVWKRQCAAWPAVILTRRTHDADARDEIAQQVQVVVLSSVTPGNFFARRKPAFRLLVKRRRDRDRPSALVAPSTQQAHHERCFCVIDQVVKRAHDGSIEQRLERNHVTSNHGGGVRVATTVGDDGGPNLLLELTGRKGRKDSEGGRTVKKDEKGEQEKKGGRKEGQQEVRKDNKEERMTKKESKDGRKDSKEE